MKTERPVVPYAQSALESGGQHKVREVNRTVYRIVMREELSERFAVAFEGMEMKTRSGQTVLAGKFIDQLHLHGSLDRMNGLGLELVRGESVHVIDRVGRSVLVRRAPLETGGIYSGGYKWLERKTRHSFRCLRAQTPSRAQPSSLIDTRRIG